MNLKYTIKATATEVRLTETYAGREATLFTLHNIDFGEARAKAYREMAMKMLDIATYYEFSPDDITIPRQVEKLLQEHSHEINKGDTFPLSFEINNGRQLRMSQNTHDGPVSVITGTQDKNDDIFAIDPGDLVTILNWYRYAKENDLPLFPDNTEQELCIPCESSDCAYNKNGICRFKKVMDHHPKITEENGCEEYLYRNEREEI